MRKKLLMLVILIVLLTVSACNNSVKNIKADYFDTGFGQKLYEGYNKVDQETVQSLVNTYNQINPKNYIYGRVIEIYYDVKEQC